ncbi:hypothetical protein [Sulfurimonas sp. C5]|uniref:tetratricopeptide repeat protein n=1 Tax=Sulfurimonas sp. C5 TaxID=3036947 RepID=UPI002457A432|nr:hypothetical protein [Sulfurimonas sp. C5]MDH4943545.1 hypothetical protein [Sulfurimonas sp. C5]
MLNTRDLERRWLKYKVKSFLPHAIITLSLIVIITSVSFYISSANKDNSSQRILQPKSVEENTSKIAVVTSTKQEEKQQSTPMISNVIDTQSVSFEAPQQDNKVVLKPSLDFMKKIQESSDGYYSNTPEEETFNTSYATAANPPKVKQKPTAKQTVTTEDVEIEEKAAPSKKIVIAKKTSLQDIRDAETRFKKNNSPALSLFLAKQYYALEDYSKSYNYALVTNQLDKENEDSWLIFSRSLVKLGKPELAKKALREYIKFSHSNNAELLLDDITTGKFQ